MAASIQISTTETTARLKGVTAKALILSDGRNEREVVRLKGGKFAITCGTCGGSGFRPEYAGIFEGVCFPCGGCGIARVFDDEAAMMRSTKAFLARRRTDARKAEARRIAAAEAAVVRHAEFVAFTAAHADTIAEITAHVGDDRILADFAEQVAREFVLTEAQLELAAKILNQIAERSQATTWFGTVGQRATFIGRVTKRMVIETQFGYSLLVLIEGTGEFTGHVFKFFGSGQALWDIEEDAEVTLTATVKAHEEYQGTHQTVMQRPKLAA